MKIAGIDVSKDSVTLCILENLPTIELKKFCKSYKPYKVTLLEAKKILDIDFDAAILEPTGGHYSKLWADIIKGSGREVRWVGHQEIAAYRKSYKLPDKTDKTDAVAICCYGIERWNQSGYFITERSEIAMQLRDLWLRSHFLNTANIPLINRIRQQLTHECPELANKKIMRAWMNTAPGVWLTLAGQDARMSNKWNKIIQETQGLGISKFTRDLARLIVENETAQLRIETEIEQLLQDKALQKYLALMEPFHFGRSTSSAILSAIYPIEKFKSRHNPLGAFKLSCGLAQIWIESGDYTGWVPGGSNHIRSALWIWAMGTIPQNKVTSPELEALRDYYKNGTTIEEEGKLKALEPGKGNQRLMRVARRAVTMLYRKLKANTI